MKEQREEFAAKKRKLDEEYALSNNPYKVGDVLQDHFQIMRVEYIGWSYTHYGTPECYYKGTQLTQKLVPMKKQDVKSMMFQCNVKRKIETA